MLDSASETEIYIGATTGKLRRRRPPATSKTIISRNLQQHNITQNNYFPPNLLFNQNSQIPQLLMTQNPTFNILPNLQQNSPIFQFSPKIPLEFNILNHLSNNFNNQQLQHQQFTPNNVMACLTQLELLSNENRSKVQ